MNKRLGILLISVAIAMGGFWSAQRFGGGIARRVKESSLVKGVKGMAPEAEKIAPQAVEESRRLLVRVFKTAKGDFKDFLPAIGVIQASLEVELKFATEGTIESLNFQEGDVVRKGDLLGALDQKDARLKLEFNQAKLKTAKTQELGAKKKLDMNKELYEIGVIIKAKLEEVAIEYETAKSQAESAQKEVAFAQSEFDKTYLYSPVNGVMGRRESEMGEVVNSNTKIAVVYDIARVSSEVGITEKDIDKVRLGQTMEVTVDTYSGQKFTGQVENISPAIEGKSRTLAIRATLENPKGELLPGMFARAMIFVYEAKEAIMVPNVALYDLDENGAFDSVYVVSAENTIRTRAVDVGYLSTDFVEITRGLRAEELVVVEVQGEIQEEAPVEIIEVQESGF